MNRLLIPWTLIVFSIFTNVSFPQSTLQKSSENPRCTSIVEASLVSDTLYSSKPPFLILHKSYPASRYSRGALLSVSDSGAVFQRVGEGLSHPDPKFYASEEIECLIDSNNRVRIGAWKGKTVAFWNIEMLCQRTDTGEADPVIIVLEPNKSVSYCIDPGEYRVIGVRFRGFDDYIDRSDSLCCTRFTIAQNAITSLGTFRLAYRWTPEPDMTIIPTRVVHRPGMGGSTMFFGGFPGGIGGAIAGGILMGGLQYLADKEKAEKEHLASPFHVLKVTRDSTYVPVSGTGLPLHFSPVSFEEFK